MKDNSLHVQVQPTVTHLVKKVPSVQKPTRVRSGPPLEHTLCQINPILSPIPHFKTFQSCPLSPPACSKWISNLQKYSEKIYFPSMRHQVGMTTSHRLSHGVISATTSTFCRRLLQRAPRHTCMGNV